MTEVKRTDSLDLEHYIKYLEENGLKPKKNPLKSRSKMNEKNVVGNRIGWQRQVIDNVAKFW